jgi:hypothetical protein
MLRSGVRVRGLALPLRFPGTLQGGVGDSVKTTTLDFEAGL